MDKKNKESFRNLFNLRVNIIVKYLIFKGTIKTYWSSSLCFFEKIRNIHKLNNQNFDIY